MRPSREGGSPGVGILGPARPSGDHDGMNVDFSVPRTVSFLLPFALLACGQVRPGPRTKELGAKAEEQAGRLVQKVTGALKKEAYGLKTHPSLGEAALQGTRALRLKEPTGVHGITVYLVADRTYSGGLELRALDEKGLEVGRSRATLRMDAGSARFVDFLFDPRTPLDEVAAAELRSLR